MTYNPFHVIRDNPSWTLDTDVLLPEGERGRWYNEHEVMLLDRDLDRIGRRCTAAHEVEHALAGDEGCGAALDEDYFTIKMERRTDSRAALKLIPLAALIEALRLYEGDDEAILEHLDVDQDMLDMRRETLQPDERRAIREAMTPEAVEEERLRNAPWRCLFPRLAPEEESA